MNTRKTIALVAHDNRKADIIDWVNNNYLLGLKHKLICTGTTGRLIEEALNKRFDEEGIKHDFDITKLKSGPLGGDQQLGSLISEGKIDIMIFLWDPMEAQPHDVDVRALLRIATLYNVPTAINRSTADFMVNSHLMDSDYVPVLKDYGKYLNRVISK